MVVIVDYGVGNLGSILNMFKKVGSKAILSGEPAVIRSADKLLLPGVGAFDVGMQRLENSGLRPLLDECVLHLKKPVLGICLGMQLMTKRSDEGVLPGLAWVDAEVIRIKSKDSHIKIPHMGWNLVQVAKEDTLLNGLPDESRFYFVHSYHVVCANQADVLLKTTYGHTFHSAFRSGNIWGVQFHPEKSHKYGMRLLKNFAESDLSC
jgi:glutamine amidotransferase